MYKSVALICLIGCPENSSILFFIWVVQIYYVKLLMINKNTSMRLCQSGAFAVSACILASAAAGAATLAVSEDGYINAFSSQRNVVQGGGTSANLNVRTPNGSGAFQYNNLAFLGFDTTGLDLTTTATASLTFTVKLTSSTNYNGDTIRLYILPDAGGTDAFDETTLTFDSAIADYGVERNNALTGQRVPGEIVGEIAAPAPGGTMTFDLSGAALDSLKASGTNNFVTFVVESRVQENAVFQVVSKEDGVQAAASLEITQIPEPSTTLLGGLALPFLLLRRRR